MAVNTDLPVLSTGLAHLVAHEAYPGHHTEHTRKEVGLVRRRQWWEESIFLVGTPQCLLAEGLADLGLEVVMGRRPEAVVAAHLRPLGIRYDAEVVAAVSEAGEALGAVRQNAAFRLHEDGADADTVTGEVARWGLLSPDRAAKAVEFLTHPTWRAYLTCYVGAFPCAAPSWAATRPGSTGCCPNSSPPMSWRPRSGWMPGLSGPTGVRRPRCRRLRVHTSRKEPHAHPTPPGR